MNAPTATGDRAAPGSLWSRHRVVAFAVAMGAVSNVLGACGSDQPVAAPTSVAEADRSTGEAAGTDDLVPLFPDVLGATASQAGDGSWTFSATLSSPYDSPDRYADAWRVVGPDGEVYGIRELTHDHASEQPFTRSQSGIEVPDGIDNVTVEGRDQISGWGGATVQVDLNG